MTAIHIPLTVLPDELLIVTERPEEKALLGEFAKWLQAGDTRKRIWLTLALWEQYQRACANEALPELSIHSEAA